MALVYSAFVDPQLQSSAPEYDPDGLACAAGNPADLIAFLEKIEAAEQLDSPKDKSDSNGSSPNTGRWIRQWQ